jgi:hypothetical protein
MKTDPTTETKTEEKVPTVAPVDPGIIMVAFSQEELSNLTSLMNITAQTFESLAIQAAQQNDEASYTVLAARHKMSNAYALRLLQFLKLGEPSSRNVH